MSQVVLQEKPEVTKKKKFRMSKCFRLLSTPAALKHGELAVIVSENLMFLQQHMATSFCSIHALSTQIDYFLVIAFYPIYFVGRQSLFLCFLFKEVFVFFFHLLMEIEQCTDTVKENFESLLHKTDTELCAEAFYKEEMDHTQCPGLGLGTVIKSS